MKFKLNGWQRNKVKEATCGCEVELRQIPAIDELTGLANYQVLSETVEAEIKRSKRSGRHFAVLIFDLNGMRQINCRHGLLAGDRALRRVAHIFRHSCRLVDTTARHGDDKFALILPESGAEAADTVHRRIRERLAADCQEPLISVSAGIAVYPEDGETLDTLFQAAFCALDRSKERVEETAAQSGFLPFVISKQKRVFAPTEVDSLTYAKVERMINE
jgi:diguanylate cyclase (GGDEF)-like protein